MIPKIIHQTWKTNEIPKGYLAYQEKVKSLHPDWEYRLWTDEDNLSFVTNHFPDFLNIYNKFPKNIMRSDMIRYLIMYKIGGLYLDLDYEMLKPFDLLNEDLVLPYNRTIKFGDKFDGLGNCVFASAPGHPFWKFVIEDFKENDDYNLRFTNLKSEFAGKYVDKMFTLEEVITGPGLLTRIFFNYKDRLTNYLLPQRELFHPVTPRNKNEYEKILVQGKAYGIHHCSGTWREKSLIKKVKLKVKSLLAR